MLDYLFSPYTIKGKTIKNRCTVPAMVTNYCTQDGKATEQYIAYHVEKAKGGWGLIITEDYAVDPLGKGYVQVAGLWNDEQIEGHKELVDRVHKYGTTILAQIYHCGRQTNSQITGSRPYAPSAIPCPLNLEMPVELTVEQIEELIEKFGDTALRAKKCGFDGVEIHGGHGYLIAEFLSPYTNKRTDQYGGNLMNRMRFPIEIIKNVRKKCGEDFIIGFRISGDEKIEGGRTIEDTKAMAQVLEEAGIDIIHVSAGTYASGDAIIPMSCRNHGWIVDYAEEVKKVVDIPVITVGRINDPYIADSVLKSGKADFTAMGRASLVDPAMPNKASNAQYEDMRHCIGCNQGCMGLLNMQKPIRCVLNPSLGREAEGEVSATDSKKNIAVIGAGPAGLETAIIAAKRGHKVTVYEKDHTAGGQLRQAAVPPFKGEIINYVNWQIEQCRKLGVEIQYHTAVNVEFMEEKQPDVIVLATGASPVVPPIKGIESSNVVLANDVLLGKAEVGNQVVVIGGGQVGAETAHHLAVQLKKVTLVEMQDTILANDMLEQMTLIPALMQRQVQIMTKTKVEEITPTQVKVNNGKDIVLNADTVVLAIGSKPMQELKQPLEEAGFVVKVLGDAQKVANILSANQEGYELGKNI